MNMQNYLVAGRDKAWSEYQQDFIQSASIEKHNDLLREWSATHLGMLFFAAQEGFTNFDLERQPHEHITRE